jgi:hypothetical protein
MKIQYKKIDKLIILIALLFSIIATIFTNIGNSKFIYFYHSQGWGDIIKQDCRANEILKNSAYFQEKLDQDSQIIFDWIIKNKAFIDITNKNKIDYINQYCVDYYQSVYVTYLAGISKELGENPIVVPGLDYTPYEISIIKLLTNIFFTFSSIIISFILLNRLKLKNEGLFRLALIFYSSLGLSVFFTKDYAVVASNLTKGFTYPTSVLIFIWVLFSIFYWVRMGFSKNEPRHDVDDSANN